MNTNNEGKAQSAIAVDHATASRKRARRLWPWLVAACAVGVAAYLLLPVVMHGQARSASTGTGNAAGGGRGMRGGPPIVPVVAAVAARGDMPVYLNGLGTVTSLDTVTVRSRVDGQLVSVNFKEGELVRKGDVLAQIDPRPYEVQLTQAEGQMAKDQASLKNAQLDLQRYQALYAQDAVPQQQLATQQATVNQLEGAIKSDEGLVASAKLNLTYSRITSPVTGRIGLRLVDPGNIVRASDANGLIVITQRQPIGIVFTIPEDSLRPVLEQLHAGHHLAVDAWDRDLKTKLATGTLTTVDNQIDPATGTLRLKAEFPNEDETLFPNQFVNARLLVNTVRDTVIVPSAAIQHNQQSMFVFVVKPDNTVEIRDVNAPLTEGDNTAVESGLAPGDVVVVEGVDKLQPGTRVVARNIGNGTGPGNGTRGRGRAGQGSPGTPTSQRGMPQQNGTAPATPNGAGHNAPTRRGRNQ